MALVVLLLLIFRFHKYKAMKVYSQQIKVQANPKGNILESEGMLHSLGFHMNNKRFRFSNYIIDPNSHRFKTLVRLHVFVIESIEILLGGVREREF